MPKSRERNPNDKIKGKGGGRIKKDTRRQMTAKFRKELAERQRGNAESPDTQAVNQTEEVTAAAVEEVGESAGNSVNKAADALHKYRQEKKRQNRQKKETGQRPDRTPPAKDIPRTPGTPPTSEIPTAPSSTASAREPALSNLLENFTFPGRSAKPMEPADTVAPKPPTPQERMRRQAVEDRREQFRHPKQATIPQNNEAPGSLPHYGGSHSTTGISKEHRSLGNQSINQSIKERPRRSTGPKEKPPGGAFTPKTRKSVEQAAQKRASAKTSVLTGKKPDTKKVMERARHKARRDAQMKMAQRTQKAAKAAADLSKKAVVAAGKVVAAMISALAGLVGGGVLIAALCVVMLIAAFIASPFGILFSNEPSKNAVPLNTAVSQINMELTDKLAGIQTGEYDSIDTQGQIPNWREVVAVFAAKTAGADDGIDVAALTPDRVERLRTVFWDMCAITSEEESINHPATSTTEAWTETVLHITITAKTADDMRTAYQFSDYQNQALTELLAELDTLGVLLDDLSISQEKALALFRSLPDDLSPERKAVIKAACSLVGKVNYFWGGKSLVIGWDSRWGTLQKVWADGSSTTGTYRPYGMDCSGFVDWTFYNATGGSYIIGHGGGAHAQHTYCTSIDWDEAIPGDLVFYPDDEHVGIVGGWDADGNILIIHCAYGYNNVVITKQEGFTTIGRPLYSSSPPP